MTYISINDIENHSHVSTKRVYILIRSSSSIRILRQKHPNLWNRIKYFTISKINLAVSIIFFLIIIKTFSYLKAERSIRKWYNALMV